MKPIFIAKGNVVFCDPSPCVDDAEAAAKSLAFAMLTVHYCVADPEKIAARVADVLNNHWMPDASSQGLSE